MTIRPCLRYCTLLYGYWLDFDCCTAPIDCGEVPEQDPVVAPCFVRDAVGPGVKEGIDQGG